MMLRGLVLSVLSVLSSLCCLPDTARAEVVSVTETSFVSRSTREVSGAPDKVWGDLVVPARWWDPARTWSGAAANLSLDVQASGCFCELLPPAPGTAGEGGSVEHLHVVHVVPGRLLRMTGGLGPLQAEPVGAVLSVTLVPAGAVTRVTFEYKVAGLVGFKGSEIAGPVDAVLAAQLARLAALSGPVPPAGP